MGAALAGALAGGVGSAFGGCIQSLAPPAPEAVLPRLLAGAAAWGLAAGATGALAGLLIGARRGRRAAVLWPAFAALWSALAGSVEVVQAGPWSGARAFLLGMTVLPLLLAARRWVGRGLWKARWLALGWLVLCLVGEGYSRLWPQSFTPLSSRPKEPVAQLWSAPLLWPANVFAVHYWLVTFDPAEGRWHRWEIWHEAGAHAPSWGHVHEDLMEPDRWVGGQTGRAEREWRGDEARSVLAVLARPDEYPDKDRYLAWPGPNSNTYPAWVLRQAGVSADLDPRGIGRDYRGRVGTGWTTTGTGVQAESALLGVKAGLADGVELHFLAFTFGADLLRPAIKTPFGCVGFGG